MVELKSAYQAFDDTCKYGYTNQNAYENLLKDIMEAIQQQIDQGKFELRYKYEYSEKTEVVLKAVNTLRVNGYNVSLCDEYCTIIIEWFNVD